MNEVPQKVGPQPRVQWSESATSEMFDPAEHRTVIVGQGHQTNTATLIYCFTAQWNHRFDDYCARRPHYDEEMLPPSHPTHS